MPREVISENRETKEAVMKTFAMAVLVGCCLLICVGCTRKQQAAEKPKAPEAPVLQLTVKMEKEKYLADEPIYFTTTIARRKEADAVAQKELILKSRIVGADGKEIPKATTQVRWGDFRFVSGTSSSLKMPGPGESASSRKDLRWCADIPPGKYTLQMTAFIDNAQTIESNTIAFEVSQEKMILPDAPVHNNVQVIVQMEKEKYAANERITFKIFVRNVDANKVIYIDRDAGLMLFNRSTGRLLDAHSKELPWNPGVAVALFGYVPVRPGQIFVSGANLKNAAEIPPGEYTFKFVGKSDELGEFESNEVKFTVEAPEPAE
jgi:hypothetical protein